MKKYIFFGALSFASLAMITASTFMIWEIRNIVIEQDEYLISQLEMEAEEEDIEVLLEETDNSMLDLSLDNLPETGSCQPKTTRVIYQCLRKFKRGGVKYQYVKYKTKEITYKNFGTSTKPKCVTYTTKTTISTPRAIPGDNCIVGK